MFIKKAAILYEKGGILQGNSYGDITSLAHRLGITSGYVYGFVDSSDNFIDRNKALEIAKAAHQVPEDFDGPLYPEDIFGAVENAID
jgi:hypothetical protein